jgi:hypothetical protein
MTFLFNGLCDPCCDDAADLLDGLVKKSMLLRLMMPAELVNIIIAMILNFFPGNTPKLNPAALCKWTP